MEYLISVVIPTYRRPQGLARCLDSLLAQDIPLQQMEVVVVDDAGDRMAREAVEKAAGQGLNARYLSQKQRGPAAARNRGVAASRSQLVGFVDDDCAVAPDWARAMVERHKEHPDLAAVGGETVTGSSRITVEISQSLANGSIRVMWQGREEVIFFPTCNVSLKKSVLLEHNFDEAFPYPGGEDLEFFWRMFKEGRRFLWDRSILVTHYREEGVVSFIRQAYVYGRGNLLVQHLHRDQPLLHELRLGAARFWMATLVNILKVPRFSVCMSRKLIRSRDIRGFFRRAGIYALFTLHKFSYIAGNIAEYFSIASGKRAAVGKWAHAPRLLIMDITHACNLECRMCDIWKTSAREKDIPLPAVRKMLREAKAAGVREVTLSGGEPLMRRDIFTILAYSRSLGIKSLGLLSNGILVEKRFRELSPYLAGGYVSLVVSLDSLDPKVHNAIRNSAHAHERTLSSLRMLSQFKKTHPAASFNVITIIFERNLEELERIAEFVHSLGADFLQFQGLLANNLEMARREESSLWVPAARLQALDKAIDGLVRFRERHPGFIKNSSHNLLLLKEYFRGTIPAGAVECANGGDTVLASNNGTYTTCFTSYGSVREETLEGVLSGETIKKAREKAQACPWPCLLPCFCDSSDGCETVREPAV